MRQQRRLVRRRVCHEVALRGNIVHDSLLLRLPVEALHQPHVDIDGRRRRHHIVGFRSHARRGEAINIQRRLIQQFQQRLTAAIRVPQPELPHQHRFIARSLRNRLLLQRAQRRDAVIEVRHQHMPVAHLPSRPATAPASSPGSAPNSRSVRCATRGSARTA